jgi:hypothetical protein
MTENPKRRNRRWLRFSLRSLLVVVTLFGVWLGIKVDQARRQKRAVETLRSMGAEVWYDHQRKENGSFDVRIDLDVPNWVRELCGDDFFQTVTGIFLLRGARLNSEGEVPRAITDEDLQCLADLPHLEQLVINQAPITDAGMAHLRHPERLRAVMLDDTDVGDDFVRRLQGAVELEGLGLEGTKVTDDAVAKLTGLTKLQILRLARTDTGDRALVPFAEHELIALRLGRKTTNAGLRRFGTRARIQGLDVAGAPVTGDAFRGFTLPTAISVELSKCAVGDNDLAPLVEAVRDARSLSLAGCAITDLGLQHLKELGKTRTLVLSNTKIQGRELGQLSSLPGLGRLDLSGCPLDDPDLKALVPLYTGTRGGSLELARTPLSDGDLAQISVLTNLRHLDLSDTKVTDRGLPHLYCLKQLLKVDLRGTGVTAEGVRLLKQAVPGREVAWDEDAGWRK